MVCKRTQQQNGPQRRVPVSPVPAGRATWCGQIRLGETRFPVKAFAANVASPSGPLCQVHAGCGRKIQQRKHCPVHGELTAADIGKAFPYGPDRLIPLTASELASLEAVWSNYSTEHFDRENKGIETRQTVQSQLKCPRALVRRWSNLGAEKQI